MGSVLVSLVSEPEPDPAENVMELGSVLFVSSCNLINKLTMKTEPPPISVGK